MEEVVTEALGSREGLMLGALPFLEDTAAVDLTRPLGTAILGSLHLCAATRESREVSLYPPIILKN